MGESSPEESVNSPPTPAVDCYPCRELKAKDRLIYEH